MKTNKSFCRQIFNIIFLFSFHFYRVSFIFPHMYRMILSDMKVIFKNLLHLMMDGRDELVSVILLIILWALCSIASFYLYKHVYFFSSIIYECVVDVLRRINRILWLIITKMDILHRHVDAICLAWNKAILRNSMLFCFV